MISRLRIKRKEGGGGLKEGETALLYKHKSNSKTKGKKGITDYI